MASSIGIDADRAEAGAATVRLQCWGDFALADAASGADLKPRGRKARALLAYLALHPGKPVSRERLAGLLWGDRAEPQARASLRQAIAELRPLVNHGRDLLAVDQDSLVLNAAAVVTDIDAMRSAAEAHDYADLIERLPERDDRLFANLDGIDQGFDDWLSIERTRQHDALFAMIADASATALAHGRTRDARTLHARLRELDPGIAPAAPTAERSPAPDRPSPPAPRAEPGLVLPRRWRAAVLVAVLLSFGMLAITAWQFGRGGPADPVAVAVLPFRDISGGGEPHFAEGVSEEILGQLARNPGLKVLGRTSAWSFRDQPLDAPSLGRRLGVEYLVEGSVRTMAERVRVDVALVRARDGAQIWSDRLDGSLGDVFAMQDRIGRSVATRLAAGATIPARTVAPTHGEAYGLYLTARGLFRTRGPEDVRTATALLRQAVTLDPDFAPAWALLGGTTAFGRFASAQGMSSDRASAGADHPERYVRHALALQPDLADGHAMLGMVLGFVSPEARAHLKRAVQLDPHDSQKLFWLSYALGAEGDYVGQLNAMRRAVAIDPTWHRTAVETGVAAWEMGYQREGVRYVERLPRDDLRLACYADFNMGSATGDYSRIAKTSAAARIVLEDSTLSDRNLGFVALTFGQVGPARSLLRMPPGQWRLATAGVPPDRVELSALYRRSALDPGSVELLKLAIRELVRAGRGDQVLALFDSGEGSLASSGEWDSRTLVEFGPNMVLALRQAGRDDAASRVMARIDDSIRGSMRRGRVPNWFHAGAAQAWSIAGRRDEALAALETAVAMGWHYVSWAPDPDIADLPAFRPLLDEPRFERIRARLKAHIARERRETGPIAI